MAMLSAASSCRFFAVKEKLVSSFMALLAVVLIAAADIEEIPLRFYEQTIEFWGLFSVFFVWRCGGCLHVEPVFEVENL